MPPMGDFARMRHRPKIRASLSSLDLNIRGLAPVGTHCDNVVSCGVPSCWKHHDLAARKLEGNVVNSRNSHQVVRNSGFLPRLSHQRLLSFEDLASSASVFVSPVHSSTSCCLPLVPVLPFVRIGDIAARAWVIMDEHAAYTESHIVMDASDNRASAPAFFARRVP